MNNSLCPPVMICGFNRPDCLNQVFDRVREAKPSQLFLVLDAPREGRPDDVEKNNACKEIFKNIDWPCEVVRDYAEKNMGCRKRMASGITNVFKSVDRCIILEDDCVPHLSFFGFCDEMLKRYNGDSRIGSIVGFEEHPYLRKRECSYYFDRFPGCWGWATWRRAWELFDNSQRYWDVISSGEFLETIFRDKKQIKRITRWFDDSCSGKSNSWATQWWLTHIVQNLLAIHPSVNLITNIGYEGAHNAGKVRGVHDVSSNGISFPLKHPVFVMPDVVDEAIMRSRYAQSSLLKRIVNKVLRVTRLNVKGIS